MAIEIRRPFCVGLDVHKNNVWCCVLYHLSHHDKPVEKVLKFHSNHTSLSEMVDWIRSIHQEYLTKPGCVENPENSEIHVFMESTGKYSTPVYNILEDQGLYPHIVNPKNVRTISGQKTDQKDCSWIAELGSGGFLKESYIPEKSIREARAVSRRRTKLVQERADEFRRVQNVMVEANIRLDLIFSDINGTSAQAVLNYLLDHDTEEPDLEVVQSLINKQCKIMKFKSNAERKEKEEELRRAFVGAKFTSTQKFILRSAQEQIKRLTNEIREHELILTQRLESYKTELDLLLSIPGISKLSAMQILAEIGSDMSVFKSVESFIHWCGLCPASNQSNKKHKSVKIGKGGKYLKPVLIQCALNAKKCSEYYKNKYSNISARRGAKRALIAIARKMMTSAYYMLLRNEPFQPTDLESEPQTDQEIVVNEYGEVLEEASVASRETTLQIPQKKIDKIPRKIFKQIKKMQTELKEAGFNSAEDLLLIFQSCQFTQT